MQFISEFTHIGDPESKNRSVADGNLFESHIGKSLFGKIIVCQLLQNISCLRSAKNDTCLRRGDIRNKDRAISSQVFSDPVNVMFNESRSCYEIEVTVTQSAHREVTLDSSLFIQHLSISEGACRLIHLITGDLLEELERARAFDLDLSEGGLIDDARLCPHCFMFFPDMLKPVWKTPSQSIFLGHSFRCKPVRPFPAILLSKDSSHLLQTLIEGACSKRSC